MSKSLSEMFRGGSLGNSTVWNLFGYILPLFVGVFSIPIVLEKLGVERFGVLMLVWFLIGYFSLFDLGIGRAVTKIVAEYRGSGRESEVNEIFHASMTLLLILGALSALAIFASSPAIVSWLSVSEDYGGEVEAAFRWVGLAMPAVILSAGLRGMLEAHHRFKTINSIKIPLGTINYFLPVAILLFQDSLLLVVVGSVSTRFVMLAFYWVTVQRLPFITAPRINFDFQNMRNLLNFGGWMTLSNIVGPLMVYMDGFVIGAVMSAAVVAFYTLPYEMATKLWVLPASLVGALFPLLAQKLVSKPEEAREVFFASIRVATLTMFPVVLVLVAFSYEILAFWLDEEFANNSYLVAQLLLIGVFINSLAHFPYALLQSAGHPRITAIIHLIELPLYLALLFFLLGLIGIEGAAIAWVVRVAVDNVLLFYMSSLKLPAFYIGLPRTLSAQFAMSSFLLLTCFVPSLLGRAVIVITVLIAASIWIFRVIREARRASGHLILSDVLSILVGVKIVSG